MLQVLASASSIEDFEPPVSCRSFDMTGEVDLGNVLGVLVGKAHNVLDARFAAWATKEIETTEAQPIDRVIPV